MTISTEDFYIIVNNEHVSNIVQLAYVCMCVGVEKMISSQTTSHSWAGPPPDQMVRAPVQLPFPGHQTENQSIGPDMRQAVAPDQTSINYFLEKLGT